MTGVSGGERKKEKEEKEKVEAEEENIYVGMRVQIHMGKVYMSFYIPRTILRDKCASFFRVMCFLLKYKISHTKEFSYCYANFGGVCEERDRERKIMCLCQCECAFVCECDYILRNMIMAVFYFILQTGIYVTCFKKHAQEFICVRVPKIMYVQQLQGLLHFVF